MLPSSRTVTRGRTSGPDVVVALVCAAPVDDAVTVTTEVVVVTATGCDAAAEVIEVAVAEEVAEADAGWAD